VPVPLHLVWFAVLRGQLSFIYFLLFHLVRYYLAALLALGFAVPRLWLLAGFSLIYAAAVDFTVKKPRLNFLPFLFYYSAEHLAYQLGVAAGCVRRRSFRSYRVSVQRRWRRPGGVATSAPRPVMSLVAPTRSAEAGT
jgi:hypothetical protein